MLTGFLNAIFVYAVAYHVQLRLTRLSTLWPYTRQHRGRPHVLNVAQLPSQRGPGAVAHTTRPEPAVVFPRHPAVGFPPSASGDTGLRGGRGSPDGFCRGSTTKEHLSCLDRFRKHISDVSTLCTLSGYASDNGGPNIAYGEERDGDAGRPEDALRRLESGTGATTPEPDLPRLRRIMRATVTRAKQHIFLTMSILLFLLVGLPLSSLRHDDLFLDIGFLFTVWLTFTSAQTRVKHHLLHSSQQKHKKSLTAIATLLNPVLWTSLFLLCYGLAKSHIHALPTATVVTRFKTGTTVSDLIAHHFLSSRPTTPLFGAGDIATSILNAGIVSWGLKLFEYRRQILSRGGLTVVLTTALLALANILAWPLLAHALGVRPAAYALSFAARSVTIALGGPAMRSLGGDAGVNAVGVVVNGIVFQLVAGCFVGGGGGGFVQTVCRWRRVLGERSRAISGRLLSMSTEGGATDEEKAQRPLPEHQQQRHAPYSSDATHVDGGRQRVPEMGAAAAAASAQSSGSSSIHGAHAPVDDVATVAAGVTIGINAAAMGTAHLYEQNSHAAPYSALAMTMFGVFTVLFTVHSSMVIWLQGMVT